MNGNGHISVNLHRYQQETDSVHLTMGISGGYAVKSYLVDKKDIFVANQAFFNVLAAYWNLAYSETAYTFSILPSAFIVSLQSTKDSFVEDGRICLDRLLTSQYREDLFEQAKENAKNIFAKSYKKEAFRARCKALEFTETNKDFSLDELIRDYEQITFEQFTKCGDMLLIPDSICVHIGGNVEEEQDLSAWQIPQVRSKANKTARIAGVVKDPYLRDDMHIILPARNAYNSTMLAVDFLNPKVANADRFFLMSILTQWLPMEVSEMSFDNLDASIMVHNEQLRPVKPIVKEWMTNESFEEARSSLLNKYLGMLRYLPEEFGIQTVRLMLLGIDILDIIEMLQNCSFDRFAEGWNIAMPRFAEAQVVMRKVQVGHVKK